VRTAARHADGEYVVMLDADLEYDPQDLPKLLAPVLDGRARVVYGNRIFGAHTAYSFWYVMGNKAITTAANVFYNSYLGDLETCFKLMPATLFRSLDIRSRGFGIEAEITAKLLRRRIKPYEVPISYRARSRDEGKKITWRDGVEALWILGRERVEGEAADVLSLLADEQLTGIGVLTSPMTFQGVLEGAVHADAWETEVGGDDHVGLRVLWPGSRTYGWPEHQETRPFEW
jgi:glycosyltransferase involved in cell wall biosynthesis